MLRITPEAGLAIQKLASTEGLTKGGGLRIESRADKPELALSITDQPAETDVVVTEETTGAHVMLDPRTADDLSDKSLDVTATVENTPRFQLTGQGTTTD